MNVSRRTRRTGRGWWMLPGILAVALGTAQAETLSEQLARQSPWSGTWKGLFGGNTGTMELVFAVEGSGLSGLIRNASSSDLDGPLTDLEIDGKSVGFGSAGGSAYSLELENGKLQGTGVTAGGGAFEIVLTPAQP